ncbi:phage tail assembly chaperone [Rhizobium setariae]|uniref:phage tail assembly chaperone n=1 Tax=Rhizobium setariae TaxID=2801340 RepID=UPI001FEDB0F0|nr:phage tail assembly chaperone [Rhizobium setariae]
MHFGLGLLRLAPHEFWSMTAVELVALSAGMSQRLAFDRANLERLMTLWPDQPRQGAEHGSR